VLRSSSAAAVTAVLLGVLAGAAPVRAAPAVPPAAATPAARWVAPVDGPLRVTRPFAPPPQRWAAGHRGADQAGTPDGVVRAAGDGVVVFAGLVAGRPVVGVAHADGLRTTYEPVRPVVAAGQRVGRGTPIGVLLAGHPGCPAAACLHWGLLRGLVYLDPVSLLAARRVRLLPDPVVPGA
jgi:murein DD-endopeptidase MepM/ murein hydrolase activator NlpD